MFLDPVSALEPLGFDCCGARGVHQVEDALAYLDLVKARYASTLSTYASFLDVMHEFKLKRVDTPGVIDRVLHLFHGDRELILGFNQFLPPGYVITMSEAADGVMTPSLSPPAACCSRFSTTPPATKLPSSPAAPAGTPVDGAPESPRLSVAAEAARDAARDALGQALGASPRAVDGLRVAIEVAELAGLEDSNEIELRRARSALTETQRDERDTERLRELGAEDLALPDEFICPITRELMVQPVVASDGFTYERSAIRQVLRSEQPESPLTREALRRDFLPNFTLLKLIREHRQHALRLVEAGMRAQANSQGEEAGSARGREERDADASTDTPAVAGVKRSRGAA